MVVKDEVKQEAAPEVKVEAASIMKTKVKQEATSEVKVEVKDEPPSSPRG
jgi:hypothetical protein